ncbi:hypothetical protein CQ038_16320, partial [Arthrobacter sp. MYb51]
MLANCSAVADGAGVFVHAGSVGSAGRTTTAGLLVLGIGVAGLVLVLVLGMGVAVLVLGVGVAVA